MRWSGDKHGDWDRRGGGFCMEIGLIVYDILQYTLLVPSKKHYFHNFARKRDTANRFEAGLEAVVTSALKQGYLSCRSAVINKTNVILFSGLILLNYLRL